MRADRFSARGDHRRRIRNPPSTRSPNPFGRSLFRHRRSQRIQNLAGVTTVTGGTITNLDAFAEAVSKAEVVGQQITSWVAHPNTVLTLMKLKDEANSNRPVLGSDPSQPTRRTALGIPLFSAPGCSPNYIWGIRRATAFVVIRVPASVETDRSAKFTSDQTCLRCVLRVGFAWPHPASVVRIGIGGS
jgi:HK97 family phage major capsid protein